MIAEQQPVLGSDILLKEGRVVQRDYLPVYDEGTFLGQLFLYREVTRERRIDAAKSEFMSLASHQLRTPLTSMRWAMSMLNRSFYERANEFEQKLLLEAQEGVGRLSDTVDTMLHISSLESGETPLTMAEIDVAGFLRELVHYVKKEFQDKQHAVSIECDPALRMRCDPNLLKELLGNLINNAFKYTPENGSIRLEAIQEGGMVRFTIQDSGYGIPTHQQAHLFKKFFRGDNIVDKVIKGTGLGLYLVSLVTNLLGGAIEFESVEGRGTTFRLRLPADGDC